MYQKLAVLGGRIVVLANSKQSGKSSKFKFTVDIVVVVGTTFLTPSNISFRPTNPATALLLCHQFLTSHPFSLIRSTTQPPPQQKCQRIPLVVVNL